MTILTLSISVFMSNLVFLFARTWNVRAVASGHVWGVMWSGAVVHISWLISIAIGAGSITELLVEWHWEYLPVVISSLCGGLLGSYIGLMPKREKA